MQHASRNTQATGILLFFSSSSLSLFFSFFRLPPRPCAFSTRSNFPIQKLRVGRKSRERTLARRFDKFLSYISIRSNFNSSNLNLRYLFHFEKKKICNSIWKRRKGNVRRRVLSFPSKIDHPAFSLLLFSPPFVPSSHPRDIESRFYGALARRGKARGVNFYSRI